ncbi:hypothetical protein QBC43DRAFT_330368 [Cladorrhinum sp. PSN259]|nr:hypothetical protein QBC43DRAFT_330368 [Cladorrhinum sp. PSN259]
MTSQTPTNLFATHLTIMFYPPLQRRGKVYRSAEKINQENLSSCSDTCRAMLPAYYRHTVIAHAARKDPASLTQISRVDVWEGIVLVLEPGKAVRGILCADQPPRIDNDPARWWTPLPIRPRQWSQSFISRIGRRGRLQETVIILIIALSAVQVTFSIGGSSRTRTSSDGLAPRGYFLNRPKITRSRQSNYVSIFRTTIPQRSFSVCRSPQADR